VCCFHNLRLMLLTSTQKDQYQTWWHKFRRSPSPRQYPTSLYSIH
jgi:hypothetical protein